MVEVDYFHRGCADPECNGAPLEGLDVCFSHATPHDQELAIQNFALGMDLDLSEQKLPGWLVQDLVKHCRLEDGKRLIRGRIDLSMAQINGTVDWSDCDFKQPLHMVNTYASTFKLSRSIFRSSPFIHEADFDGDFVCAESKFPVGGILGEITAEAIVFRDSVFETNTVLAPDAGLVDFSRCRFSGRLDMHVLSDWSPGRVSFVETEFDADIWQFRVRGSIVTFSDAVVHSPFTASIAAEWVDLTRTRFLDVVDLEAVGAGLNLQNSSFSSHAWVTGGKEPDAIFGSERPWIANMQRARVNNVRLAGVDLETCVFARAEGLEELTFEDCTFARVGERNLVADEQLAPFGRGSAQDRNELIEVNRLKSWHIPQQGPGEVGATYRQLRLAREAVKDWAGANDFYYGEMNLRRMDPNRPIAERLVLAGYRIVSGYGLRASYAISWLLLTFALAVFVYAAFGDCGRECHSELGAPIPNASIFAQVARDSFHVVSGPRSGGAVFVGTQIAVRLLIPALLALALFAVRSRVRR